MHVEDLTLTNAKYILGVLKADLIFYQLTICYGNNSNLLRLTTEWWTTEFNDMPHRIPTIFLRKLWSLVFVDFCITLEAVISVRAMHATYSEYFTCTSTCFYVKKFIKWHI